MAAPKTTKGIPPDDRKAGRGASRTSPAGRPPEDPAPAPKLGKETLARALSQAFELTYDDALSIWDFILAQMSATLTVEAGSVVLTNIGTLTTIERASRVYKNPRTGEDLGPRRVLTLRFQPSRNLRDQLKDQIA